MIILCKWWDGDGKWVTFFIYKANLVGVTALYVIVLFGIKEG